MANLTNTAWRILSIDSLDTDEFKDMTAHISCTYKLYSPAGDFYTDMTGFSFSKKELLGHRFDEFKPLPNAINISVGDIIEFVGDTSTNTALMNSDLIQWFNNNATQVDINFDELPKLYCAVDFDYDLIQDDCHWDLDRYYKFTFKVFDRSLLSYNTPEFYYSFGDYQEVPTGKPYLDYYSKVPSSYLIYNKNNTWIYHLRVSDMNQIQLANLRDTAGNLKVTALIRVSGNIAHETFSQYLELPPTLAAKKPGTDLTNIQTDYVKANPGEFVCTWSPATVVTCGANEITGVDTVDGYSIEVFYKPEKADDFVQLKGIKWNDDELVNGVYKLIKDPDYKEPEFSTSPDLSKDFSLESQHTMSEVRIESPLKTEFFFTPKTLGILPGSSYQFRIYPYSHYEGALISTKGTASGGIDVPKGIVRVKTAGGWVEGQVWVMTESGWKNAEVIYAMTEDGWKEAQ